MIDLERWRKFALIAGTGGLLLTAIGLFVSPAQFFRSYLWAFLFWFGVTMGCLPLLMLYHLVGGAWGFTVRRIIESGTRTLPVIAIFFVPILFGIPHLYEWSHADKVAEIETLRQKQPYLNVPFWILRAVFYFAVWLFYTYRLNRLSVIQDRTGDVMLVKKFQKLSGPGLAVYALTVTFAAFDWAMSLEPEWYSTIYGMLWMVGQALSALAFAIAMVALLSDTAPLSRLSLTDNLHDLGNLLLAFVMLWAYLSFSQLLIIWSGNLPEEIPWYLSRIHHGWEWVAGALITLHFFVPFFLLLARSRKRRIRSIAGIAVLVLVMRIVDTFWVITPAFYSERVTVHWLDLFAVVGIGGIWLATYARQLAAMPLLPLHDPNAAPHKVI
jgi:hypothetical protein